MWSVTPVCRQILGSVNSMCGKRCRQQFKGPYTQSVGSVCHQQFKGPYTQSVLSVWLRRIIQHRT